MHMEFKKDDQLPMALDNSSECKSNNIKQEQPLLLPPLTQQTLPGFASIPPELVTSLLAQNPALFSLAGRPQQQNMAMPPNLIPSQILKVYTIPTGDNGWQIVLQDATPMLAPSPASIIAASNTINNNYNGNVPKPAHQNNTSSSSSLSLSLLERNNHDNHQSSSVSVVVPSDAIAMVDKTPSVASTSSIPSMLMRSPLPGVHSRSEETVPPKKRRHYDDGSTSPIQNGHHSSISTSDEDDTNNSSKPLSSTMRSVIVQQTQDLQEAEKMKSMTPEEVKRERNRLAADRCRKKKLAKIDQLSKEVQQMEKQRQQVLYQLDSLRHAAIAARDAVRNHKTAGCGMADETGALHRLIAEAEALDLFVKTQQI